MDKQKYEAIRKEMAGLRKFYGKWQHKEQLWDECRLLKYIIIELARDNYGNIPRAIRAIIGETYRDQKFAKEFVIPEYKKEIEEILKKYGVENN